MPAQTDPVAPDKEVTIKLFRSWHNGFGDSDEVHFNHRMETYMPTESVTTRYNRTHGSIDARRVGQIRMGMQVKRMSQTNHDLTPLFAVEWVDVLNNIYPAIYYLVGKKIMKIRFGVTTEVGSDALATNVTGGMLDDDGSGVPYLYASFGGAAGAAKIRRMNVAGAVTTSAAVVAALLLSLNGDAYRTVTPTGGTSNCQVSKCPYGQDRFVAANWGAGTTVGFAGTDINALVVCRQAPVALKPEGVFAYNQGLDRWINYTPSWTGFRHLNNGKGAFFLGDRLVVPMGDGGAVIFDGNNVTPFDPGGLDSTPNLHTTKTAFSTMAALRHHVAGATKSNSKRSSLGNSLEFLRTVDDAAFIDDSTSVRDLDLTTYSALPANAALKVYIGWDHPFCGIDFENSLANTNAVTLTLKVGTGAGTWSAAVGVVDFTTLAGATLGQSGQIVMTEDPIDGGKAWIQTAVNGITKYWVQLTFSGAPTAIQWANCQLQPWYPSMDKTLFPLDGLDKSGCFPHILLGKDDKSGAQPGVWHDVYSLSRPDDIGCIVFADAGGSGINKSRHMLAIGRFNVWEILTADDDKGGTEPAPVLNDVGLIEGPAIVPSSAVTGIAPGTLVRLKNLKVFGHDFDPAWKFLFYYTWDAGKPWNKANTELRPPINQDFFEPTNKGYRFRWALGWAGTAGQALSQACVTDVEATFELLTTPVDQTQERAVQTLPRI